MKTRCPECDTLFNLTEKQLQQANGQVQCGHCFYIFTAEPEPEEDDEFRLVEATQQLDTSDIDLNTFADSIDEIPDEEPLIDEKTQRPGEQLFEKNPMIDDLVPPEIRHQTNESRRYMTAIWSLLVVVLILTGSLQMIYFNRDNLANRPGLRPYMLSFCDIAGCKISELRDLKRLELSSKNVYSHPNVDNALMITAVIVNQAEFAQRFPVLQISFTNLVGDIVMARQFKPGEYLNTDEKNLTEMQPGLPIQITLEVLDPGNSATAYEFNFI